MAFDHRQKSVKTITVTSGKGGVGKTNMVANLAIALRRLGKEVMILDADLGLSNIDVLLDLAPKYNIQHVINGEKTLKEVVIEGPHGIRILPASSGVQEMTELDEFQRMRLIAEFESYDANIDYLLIDTGAGISANVAFFCIASQEIVIVTTPEPTALTDAYALIKVLFNNYQEKDFRVLVNSAKNSADAIEVFRRLSLAAEKFLNISLDYLGYVPLDESVRNAVRQQKAFLDEYPECDASRQVSEIASKLHTDNRAKVKGTLQLFIGNLLRGERNVPA